MKQCYEKFKALGEETRFRIVAILSKSGRELCACEIINSLGKAQYTISKAMSILVGSGMVLERREGKMMMYSLNSKDPQVKALLQAVKIVAESQCGVKADFERLSKCIGN